jgi:hypothetical protein
MRGKMGHFDGTVFFSRRATPAATKDAWTALADQPRAGVLVSAAAGPWQDYDLPVGGMWTTCAAMP